jgi:primary-amine oxidase
MFNFFSSATSRLWRHNSAVIPGIVLLVNATVFAANHPLDALSEEEIAGTVQVLKEVGKVSDASRYMSISLREPPKDEILKFKPGAPFSRQAVVIVHERVTKQSFEAVVDLNTKTLVSWKELRGVQPAFPDDEVLDILRKAVRADTHWQEALTRRGITDFDAVAIDPWPVGYYGIDNEIGGRYLNAIPYYKGRSVNYYARPIEGLRAVVDVDTGKVLKVVDTGNVPIAKATADLDMHSIGHQRTMPNALQIQQPDGPSFLRKDNLVRWQNWSFRFSLHPREGMVLQTVGYEDGGRVRPILYRGSVSEMVVPYADPGPNWYFRNVFDEGEVGLGWLTVSQEPLTDCPPQAEFVDAVLADEFGKPHAIPRAFALYERDGGILFPPLRPLATTITDSTGFSIRTARLRWKCCSPASWNRRARTPPRFMNTTAPAMNILSRPTSPRSTTSISFVSVWTSTWTEQQGTV